MKSTFDLKLLFLSKKERVVLTGLKAGLRTPLLLHIETKISRTAVYHILKVLRARGLAYSYKEKGKFYVRIATEKEMADILYETKKELLAFTDGKDEIVGNKDSVVIVHRGVEALRACYHEMFTKYKENRFIGVQGHNTYQFYKDTIGLKTINKANALIKKNKIISEGILAEGSIEKLYALFGDEWAKEYGGRMANIHALDQKYFKHGGEIFIFKDTVYLLAVADLIIIEIRHSDIAVVITMLIKYIMDTTRTIDVNKRLRELMEHTK